MKQEIAELMWEQQLNSQRTWAVKNIQFVFWLFFSQHLLSNLRYKETQELLIFLRHIITLLFLACLRRKMNGGSAVHSEFSLSVSQVLCCSLFSSSFQHNGLLSSQKSGNTQLTGLAFLFHLEGKNLNEKLSDKPQNGSHLRKIKEKNKTKSSPFVQLLCGSWGLKKEPRRGLV